MRAVLAASALGVAAACGGAPATPAPDPAASYLHDGAFRRATLEASLVNPSNGYSSLRLSHYERDWAALPEWSPRVEPVAAGELDVEGGAALDAAIGAGASALAADDAALAADPEALRALGEQAFSRYPVQLAPQEGAAIHTRADAARYGEWVDDARGVGGLVRVALADGQVALARTCATCHATAAGAAIGAPNDGLDLGRMMVDVEPTLDAEVAARMGAWGPGRLDVTTAIGTEPVRIPDLRPVRWLSHLQADGTVKQENVAALAVRIETLIVTSNAMVLRPPRVIALALATYVWSLADALPSRAPASDAERRGQAYFAGACEGCHAAPGYTGAPVALDVVGTDPAIGMSTDRGTGKYRVPSLRGVATRGALLHDGSAPDLATMFDPARLDPGFAGGRHGAGPIPGHTFGLDADAATRADLVGFLGTL